MFDQWLTQNELVGLCFTKLDEFLRYKLFQILLNCLKGQCLNESQRKVDESIGKIIFDNFEDADDTVESFVSYYNNLSKSVSNIVGWK